MTPTVDESETQYGVEPDPKPKSEPDEAVPEPQPEAEGKQSEPKPEAGAVTSGADPKLDRPEETSIRSNDNSQNTPSDSAPQESAHPELRKDQGSRTFTMRELLNGLKNDQGNDAPSDAPSPYRSHFSFIRFMLHFLSEILLGL